MSCGGAMRAGETGRHSGEFDGRGKAAKEDHHGDSRGLEEAEATDLLDPEAVRTLVMADAQSIRDFMRATTGGLPESSTSDADLIPPGGVIAFKIGNRHVFSSVVCADAASNDRCDRQWGSLWATPSLSSSA
jgi:hypothetical protein